jgi:hypothetical protein
MGEVSNWRLGFSKSVGYWRAQSKQVSMSCRRLLLGVRGIYDLHVRDLFGRGYASVQMRCDGCSMHGWFLRPQCVSRRQQSRKLINRGRSTNAPSVRPRALSSYRQGCGINDNDNPGAWQRRDKGILKLDGINPSRRMRVLETGGYRALFCLRGHLSLAHLHDCARTVRCLRLRTLPESRAYKTRNAGSRSVGCCTLRRGFD